jgi:hypothetical protein
MLGHVKRLQRAAFKPEHTGPNGEVAGMANPKQDKELGESGHTTGQGLGTLGPGGPRKRGKCLLVKDLGAYTKVFGLHPGEGSTTHQGGLNIKKVR